MGTRILRCIQCMLLACTLSLVLMAQSASGQTVLQVIPPGGLILGGEQANCMYAPTVIISAGPYAGYAWYDPARGNIILNHDQFGNLPRFLMFFVYAHECGHRVYGLSEDTADCFAAKLGRIQGWFPPMEFPMIVQMFANAPGDWTHRPGPQRIQHIATCHMDPAPP